MTIQAISISSHQTEQTSSFSTALFQILGGSLLIALCAQIKIPLFFSPIPLSLQTLAVMLVAGFLGRRKGFFAVASYLGLLCYGLPVAAGGVSAPLALIGASGGYLIGFAVQAYLVGLCAENRSRMTSLALMGALVLISFLQLGLGTLWLGAFIGMNSAFLVGLLPFIPGEILKATAATIFISKRQS
ncbi:biotin transporter BioY [Waddlia chondrophila]|uniref:biotin transporter BioY n=1 Tax=Waddlia chondrophila TaxID=71667 RepID=UPI0007A74FB6|nr:biotin transporter BioY [Waddlia chondrophila]